MAARTRAHLLYGLQRCEMLWTEAWDAGNRERADMLARVALAYREKMRV